MLQRDLHHDLKARARASQARIAALVRPLDDVRLHQRPAAGGWSVGEVLEHLCLTDSLYEAALREAMRTARADAGAPLREHSPTLVGGFLARSLANPRKLPSPRKAVPGPSPRGGVLEDFLARQHAFVSHLDDAASLDWRRIKLRSPLVPLLPRFNLGDVFTIDVVHVERHTRQMARIIEAIGGA